MQATDSQILEVMSLFGISQEDIRRAQTNGRALDAFKARVKKAYRQAAHQLHPDKNNNDPEKARLFQLAGQVVEEINAMRFESHPRRVKWAVRVRARAAM